MVADEATRGDARVRGRRVPVRSRRRRGDLSTARRRVAVGASIECGHYVARVRGDDDAWTTFDDEDARETSAEEVVGGARERDWYVAAYEAL